MRLAYFAYGRVQGRQSAARFSEFILCLQRFSFESVLNVQPSY